MEESLTPMARALRKFSAGRPPIRTKDTPLGAVFLAVEQRDRLTKILASEEGLEHPRITAAAIVGRLDVTGSDTAIENEFITIEEGKESAAVAFLEDYRVYGHKFTLSGLMFAVRAGKEARLFSYRIERTPEGDAVLKLAEEQLLNRPSAISVTQKD